MRKFLKPFFALGIFICLFLPLSQCSYTLPTFKSTLQGSELQQTNANNLEKPKSAPLIVRVYGIPDNFSDWLLLGAFIFPLLFCLYHPKRIKFRILSLVLQTASACWLFYVVYLTVYALGEPLYGGYLLTLFSIAYFIYTLFEWYVCLDGNSGEL